jgi:carboxymethylenebutenolidase
MLLPVLASLALQQGPSSCCTSGMDQFLDDPSFAAMHMPPVPFAFQAKSGKMVHFKATDGKEANGFFVPAKSGNRSALLVFHEWWGLNDYIKQEAERLHDELGSAVLAVDLYDGKVATTAEEAQKLMSAADKDAARTTAISNGARLAIQDGSLFKAGRIGTIGWCFGGGQSFWAAVNGGSAVNACVIYYGMPSTDPAVLAKLKAPVLMIWGTQDGFINSKVVDGFKAAMNKARKSLQTVSYDAVHAFANPSNPKYDAADAADAHRRTLAFLKPKLK